jgi:hypothetical protein
MECQLNATDRFNNVNSTRPHKQDGHPVTTDDTQRLIRLVDDLAHEVRDHRAEHDEEHRKIDEFRVRTQASLENGVKQFEAIRADTRPVPTRVVVLSVLGVLSAIVAGSIWFAQALDSKAGRDETRQIAEEVRALTRTVDRLSDKLDIKGVHP